MSTSPSPLIDMARDIHDRFKKFMSYIPGGNSEQPQTDHDKAIAEMNKKANDDRANEATQSFAAAQAKMKGQANSYDSTKKQPLKSYSK